MLEHARAGRTAAAAFFGESFATGTGQLNTLTEVNDVLAMKWLTEGIAWYAAGQFDDRGRSQVRTLIAGGYTPTSLGEMWWDEG
jgi:hypothetical protein